ncbi:hypothetical protein EVAR_80599_1 [Eumeta japonica]|uniref:Uncharacterized protein n=1 Tax=Eumeta variegata TaxID=151549 RepID=A0A4C1TLG7_EUMVA|nr:hypothetical protein EVAR_80599_1 [Eumeta japonica]
MFTADYEHSQSQRSHQCVADLLGGIGYLMEELLEGGRGVGYRNSNSLDTAGNVANVAAIWQRLTDSTETEVPWSIGANAANPRRLHGQSSLSYAI